MNRIIAKLRSRRGASISMALLVFLVCAIISGVVIVAATAVGGRASGLREADERYYAATAAARKLQAIFDGTEVTVTYNPSDDEEEPETTASNDGLEAASVAVAMNKAMTAEAQSIDGPTENGEASRYGCTVTPRLSNGLMNFDIVASGPSGSRHNGTYKLTVVFASNLKKPETTDTTSATATVTWSLHSLSKGRANTPTGSTDDEEEAPAP